MYILYRYKIKTIHRVLQAQKCALIEKPGASCYNTAIIRTKAGAIMDHKVNLNKILAEGFKPDAKRKKRLKTGFDALDHNLGGGLSPGLIILGGTPGVGKSTFALQLAEHVAETGTPVLYFSMEMPGERILAKAISRNLYKKNREQASLWLSAEELMGGDGTDPLTPEQWEQVDIIKHSLEPGLKDLHLWTDTVSASVIVKRVQELAAATNQKPLVIIDYLQILTSDENRSQTEKQSVDRTLKLLMSQLAHGEGGVPVILISSLNRSSYGAIQISAFKETGGIEYSADVLLGLQSGSQTENSREVELSILKNRYGPSGNKLKFLYHSRYDYFEAFPSRAVETTSSKTDQPSAASETADAAVPAPAKKKAKKNKSAEKYFDSYINNTKIANEIRKGEGVGRTRSCSVFDDVHTIYKLSAPLSSLDCCVADAVYTLYKAAEDPQDRQAPVELSLSLSQILLVLTGNRQRTLTESKAAELEQSIDRLMGTKLYLDCISELQERAKKKKNGSAKTPAEEGWVYNNGPFLVLKKYLKDRKTGQERQVEPGQTEPGCEVLYRFSSQDAERGILPLYTYGERTGEMIAFSSRLLNVTKTEDGGSRLLSNTAETICLKRFLIHRLEVFRYDGEEEQKSRKSRKSRESRNWLNTISFRPDGSLMTELRLPPQVRLDEAAQKRRLKRLHDTVAAILDYYKEIHYISDFKRVRHQELPGRKALPDSFQIEMPVNRKKGPK